MFECDECNKAFETQKGLAGHMSRSHAPKIDKEPETKTETMILTPEEQSIANIVAADNEPWGPPIREDELNDFSLAKNQLDLHPSAWKLQVEKVYAFRWCERERGRIDQLTRSVERPLAWKTVNRMTCPELAHLVDDLNGGVCKLDQILLFKPWNDHAIVQQAKVDLAEVSDKSGTLAGKSQELSGDGIHAHASVRTMGGNQRPSEQEVGGSDVVMAEASDLSDIMVED